VPGTDKTSSDAAGHETNEAVMTLPDRPLSVRTLAHRRQFAADAIERAAIELFGSHAVEHVTAADIAAAAGVSVRTFYRYFAGKQEILIALPRRRASQIADATVARPLTEAPFTAMRQAIAELSHADDQDLRAWRRAVEKSRGADRMTQLVVAVTSPILTQALTARIGPKPAGLWSEVAGATVATALVSGARQWSTRGGSLRTHILAAVDIVGAGLSNGPH